MSMKRSWDQLTATFGFAIKNILPTCRALVSLKRFGVDCSLGSFPSQDSKIAARLREKSPNSSAKILGRWFWKKRNNIRFPTWFSFMVMFPMLENKTITEQQSPWLCHDNQEWPSWALHICGGWKYVDVADKTLRRWPKTHSSLLRLSKSKCIFSLVKIFHRWCTVGPLPILSRVITPLIEVITPVIYPFIKPLIRSL